MDGIISYFREGSMRRSQVLLSQPLHVAQVFTGSPGEYDALPEQAFYMLGGIEESAAKAKTLS